MYDLKRKVLTNAEENTKDQCKDTLAALFSAFDLDSQDTMDSREEKLGCLWEVYGKDYTHTTSLDKYCGLDIVITYKRKVTCNKKQLEDDFTKAYPVLTQLAKRRRDAMELQRESEVEIVTDKVTVPTQLSLLQEFIKQNEMSFFYTCQMLRIALSIAPNTGWIERSYSHLALICQKQRNRMDMKTMELLYLLKEIDLPVKSDYVEERCLLKKKKKMSH